MSEQQALLDRILAGQPIADDDAMALADCGDLAVLMAVAAVLRDELGYQGLILTDALEMAAITRRRDS